MLCHSRLHPGERALRICFLQLQPEERLSAQNGAARTSLAGMGKNGVPELLA